MSEPSQDMRQFQSAQESKMPDTSIIENTKEIKKPEKAGSEIFKTTQ